MAEAEEAAVNETFGAGKTFEEQEQYRLSGTHLEVNAIFPFTDPTCLAAFSPDGVRPPPPAPTDEQYTGPEVDLDNLLNTRFVLGVLHTVTNDQPQPNPL